MDSKSAETQHPSRIVWIGGSKGGVGKSMTTMAALDYLLSKGSSVVLVECDNANPMCIARTSIWCPRSGPIWTTRTVGFTSSTSAMSTGAARSS